MNKHNKGNIFIGVLIICALGAAAISLRPEFLYSVKNLWHTSGGGLLLEQVRREFSAPGGLIFPGSATQSHLTQEGTVSFTNIERTNGDLTVFIENEKLNRVAEDRLADMFEKQYFEHEYLGGMDASTLAGVAGYDYISIGENIALGNFKDDAALVTAWMNSPGHRANILNGKFTEIGVAVRKGQYKGEETWMAAQIFGRPKSDCPEVSSALKKTIDFNTSEIERLHDELDQRREGLEEMEDKHGRNRDLYNEEVEEYNTLARTVNNLVEEVKADITEYNREVRSFNRCIGA